MDQRTKLIDRRRYEKRGMAVRADLGGRTPSPSTISTLHEQMVKKYGDGWEVDSVYPGAICEVANSPHTDEGHMVIFKRRRQLRDE